MPSAPIAGVIARLDAALQRAADAERRIRQLERAYAAVCAERDAATRAAGIHQQEARRLADALHCANTR